MDLVRASKDSFQNFLPRAPDKGLKIALSLPSFSPRVILVYQIFIIWFTFWYTEMSVVSVKVPRWVKEKMREYGDVVNWPEEIRKSIIAKLEELERRRAVEEAVKLLEKVRPAPMGTAERLVREDRDSR